MNRTLALILTVVFSVFLMFSVVSVGFVGCLASEDDFGWKFVILGDTQDLVHQPNLFFNATYWIANQSDIVYVAQMGDLVDNRDNLTQWQTAYDAMHVLDGHASWGTVPGNHDLLETSGNGTAAVVEDATNYNSFFGDCEHYDIIRDRFIFIYVRFDRLDYAEAVLQGHPKLYAIIVTHSYVSGNSFDVNFQKTLAKYDNVIAVLCGHTTGATLIRYSDGQGDIDNLILTNYQDIPITNALKVCTVYQDRIDVETFEPMTNTYRNGSLGFLEKFSFLYGKNLNAGFVNDGKLFAQTDLDITDIKIADLTSDVGNEVVVVANANNTVAVFNSTGDQTAVVHQEQVYSLEVIDLNNDGKLEIVCGGKDLIVYDGNLQILEILLSGRNSTRPVMVNVADVDKDTISELLAVDVDNNSLTRFRVWREDIKIVDVWVEENLPANLYEPRVINYTGIEFVELENGTTVIKEVPVEETITYDDVWPTSPIVADLDNNGKNEVYVDVPCDYIVSYDDNYVYTGYHGNWRIDTFVDEDGDGQFDVLGTHTDILNGYPVSPLGYFYVGESLLNEVGYDLDGDGDSEFLWTDLGGNICTYDEGKMSVVNSDISLAILYAGSLQGDGTTDILAVTNGAIYVYENYRRAYTTEELQNVNNEYWFDNLPNILSANSTVIAVSNQPAPWYSVNTKFTATVNATQQECAQIQIDVGCLGNPTGVLASEWSYNETSKIVTWKPSYENPTITLYWTQISGKELPLVLPYLVVAGFTLTWLYVTVGLPKKKGTKIQHKTVAIGASITALFIVMLLVVNFII